MVSLHGTVKFFSAKRGYGFIIPDDPEQDGQEFFVHHSVIAGDGFRSLAEGEEVEFEVQTDPKTQKLFAINVTGPDGAPVKGVSRMAHGEKGGKSKDSGKGGGKMSLKGKGGFVPPPFKGKGSYEYGSSKGKYDGYRDSYKGSKGYKGYDDFGYYDSYGGGYGGPSYKGKGYKGYDYDGFKGGKFGKPSFKGSYKGGYDDYEDDYDDFDYGYGAGGYKGKYKGGKDSYKGPPPSKGYAKGGFKGGSRKGYF